MKPRSSLILCLCLWFAAGCASAPLSGQSESPPVVVSAQSADHLEQLVAPIALYPDVLVALILPAATESSDVVLAARFLREGGDVSGVDAQPWDEDVKGLARYPDVVKWMDENLAWTQQIGDAYLAKPEDVMAAVQRARARAHANGVLVSTAQQAVVVENGYIRIVPAQPEVIYVPRYDPEIIYVEHRVYRSPDPWITFGAGFGVGWWLRNDCDWGRRVIVVDHRHRDHWRHHDWRHHHFTRRPGHGFHHDHWRPWTPRPGHRPHHHRREFRRHDRIVVHPSPIAEAPRFRREHREHRGDRPHRPDWEGRRDRDRADSNAHRPREHR
ncbi:MAG TPA: DUF3300 domain-containing protein, partial [Opitutus sp.]|nr:DUF3300 domain-containing protein [Opitutus sp.]